MSHREQTRNYLEVVVGHARIAIDDEELTPVEEVIYESLWIGWKRDLATLNGLLARREDR